MKLITAPIAHNQTGSVAVNLIECILFLIEKNLLKIYDAPNQPNQDEINTLIAGAKLELATQLYGENAQRLVLYFQLQNGLGDNLRGWVDDKTAARFNEILQSLGVHDETVTKYVVKGQVTSKGSPVSMVEVVAYDKDMYAKENLLGETQTDKEGYFKIEYTEAQFKHTDKEKGGADLIVRIVDAKGTVIASSHKINNAKADETVNVEIGNPEDSAPEHFIVHGLITKGGKPLVGVLVNAYDKDVRRKEWLGEAVTNAKGNYEIVYGEESFTQSESATADLIIEVLNTDKKLLGASAVFFNVARKQEINLALLSEENQKSEWEIVSDQVFPLLKDQKDINEIHSHLVTAPQYGDLQPFELTDEDIDFIVSETSLNRLMIKAWVDSSRMLMNAIQKLGAEHNGELTILRDYGWSFFYAHTRLGRPVSLSSVARLSTEQLQKIWRNALLLNRVPIIDEKYFAILLSAIDIIHKLLQIEPDIHSNDPFVRLINSLPVLPPQNIALDAFAIYSERGLQNPDAFLILKTTHPDLETEINHFVRAIRVHQLVEGHKDFSTRLNALLSGDLDSIAPLATISSTEWLKMANETSLSPALALQMQANVETLHPLVALQAKVAANAIALPGVTTDELNVLIKNEGPTVEAIIRGKKVVKDDSDSPETHKVLRDVGRFIRTGVNMENAGHLIGAGIKNPGVAIRYGREAIYDSFRDKYPKGVMTELVDSFFDASETAVGTGVAFWINMGGSHANFSWTNEEVYTPLPEGVRENLPTLPGLFGDLDECICKPCESMLGQPAYLVDLLNLLGKNSGALQTLKARRPKIFTMELSCENAEKSIQHIDIVLEILEEAADPSSDKLHYQQVAYEKLGSAIFSWQLPFDRGFAEVKAYLTKLGVSRVDLLSKYSGMQENFLAAETLNLSFDQTSTSGSTSEWNLLTRKKTGDDLWKVYGFTRNNDIAITDPASGEYLTNQTLPELLSRGSILIDRTELDLESLEEILATRFVGGLRLSNRNQCKTSQMYVTAEGSVLEECLDRLHRFARLHKKLTGWSVEELDSVIVACGGVESQQTVEASRINLLKTIAQIKRLSDRFNLPIDYLVGLPSTTERLVPIVGLPHSINKIYPLLGLTARQFQLLKTLTGLDLTSAIFDWTVFEKFCEAAKCIAESGLTVEQISEALLSRDTLTNLIGELPPSLKTDEEIKELLIAIQNSLYSVVEIQTTTTLESQVSEALTAIFNSATADNIVSAIRSAGNIQLSERVEHLELLPTLHGEANARSIRKLGDWLPLMTVVQAEEILKVDSANNLNVDTRLEHLLKLIADRRREQELITIMVAQSGLSQTDVSALLSSRLQLDSTAQSSFTKAADVFLSKDFWADVPPISATAQPTRPSTALNDVPHLYAWVDRFFRMAKLSSGLNINSDLMQLVDSIVLNNGVNIQWRDFLAAYSPVTNISWSNAHWQAFLDLIWLQRPEHLSRPVLSELLSRLVELGTHPININAIRPLAVRVNISEMEALVISNQIVSNSNAANFRNTTNLRKVFELLLLAKHLGTDHSQLTQLIDVSKNTLSATTAKNLLQTKLDDQEWQEAEQKIEDQLRQQRRDALVAYHIHRDNYDQWKNVNDLYEEYLIDPQMEPCFETTRLLEAITATQLFAQRILFGIETGIRAGEELKKHWSWMRNYRVWEANRKVFLFPENWLFPELRDDKSSSFMQLEAALGQGELTQDLAQQSFGQFLDDVAQMGQIQVLGMYEDVASDELNKSTKRDLYLVGRTPNPPYTYYWRKCLDFGSPHMEWSPWQRVELDIQGDHVLIFIYSGDLFIAWPVLQTNAETKDWLLTCFWSRYNGKTWHHAEKSQTQKQLPMVAFNTTESTFSFRVQPKENAIYFVCYGAQATELTKIDQLQAKLLDINTDLSQQQQIDFNGNCFNQNSNYFGHLFIPSESDANIGSITHANPTNANNIGAVHIVSWEVWIKANNFGSPGYIKVNVDPGGFTNPKFQLKGKIGEAPIFNRNIGWELGLWLATHPNHIKIPPIKFQATYKGFTSAEISTDEIQINKFGKTHLVMVITPPDSHLPTLAELGISDPSTPLKPLAKLLIADSSTSAWLDPQLELSPLYPTEYSNFCNGMEGSGTPLLLRSDESSYVLPFATGSLLTPRKFSLLGAADIERSAHGSQIWFYREGSSACFFDIPKINQAVAYGASFVESHLYRRQWQQDKSSLKNQYSPITFGIDRLLPIRTQDIFWHDQVDGKLAFDARLPYACYNWEVFFHAPLLVADQLSKQHKFEEAEQWLRYVFDPTCGESGTDATRFLKFRIFKELDLRKQVVEDLTALAQAAGGFATDADIAAIDKIINRWRDLPFRPFIIARGRHIAFLWRTLFAYLDNLIAWADSLYRRDTRESINEATMLYILAERILGKRPALHAGHSNHAALNYEAISQGDDAFSNFWIDAVTGVSTNRSKKWRDKKGDKMPPNPDGVLYFCMPFNDKIFSYWNTVEARLYNVRNCRNIEGVMRTLPLMDAPIDPELLIRATAAGLDLDDVINGLYAPPPHYRYNILASRAAELINEVKSLGGAMLSAIEKRDAEHISQLRSSNEISLLKLVSDVKNLQITEAERNIDALRASRKSTENRYNQYQRLLGKKDSFAPTENSTSGEDSMLGSADAGMASHRSGLGLIKEENEQYLGVENANTWSTASGIAKIVGSGLHASASIVLATPAGATNAPKVLEDLGTAASHIGDAFSTVSQFWRTYAEQQGMIAGHLRRRDEWAFQSNQTLKELQQIDKQLLANQIRIDITKNELSNHSAQIEQSKAMDEVMRNKFTNEQLYQWMLDQLSTLYFSSYRMALDMARRAERAASRELGATPLNILRNDYWDSLRMGLLAGDKLHQDLKRLEIAYIDQNRREYEMTKHISLRQLDPEALIGLRFKNNSNKNSCEFSIPEWLFDLDTPGHYLRRIKSVNVSIPCIAGPYTSVNCKLTLLKCSIRHNSMSNDYLRDDHFSDYYGASEAIVTSNANSDSGLFETALHDERFLPFEHSGVISSWRLELPDEYAQFDYSTISDVILSIRYTARDGGDQLREAATASITSQMTQSDTNNDPLTFSVILSCRSDFSNQWARVNARTNLLVPITSDLIPYRMGANMKILNVRFALLMDGQPITFRQADLPVNRDNIGYADLRLIPEAVKDVIVLLTIGK